MFNSLPPEIISEIFCFLDFDTLRQLHPLSPSLLHPNTLKIQFVKSIEYDLQNEPPIVNRRKFRRKRRRQRYPPHKSIHYGKEHVYELNKLKTFFMHHNDTQSELYRKKTRQFHHHRICILQNIFLAQQRDKRTNQDFTDLFHKMTCRWRWFEQYNYRNVVTRNGLKILAVDCTHRWLTEVNKDSMKGILLNLKLISEFAPLFVNFYKNHSSMLPLGYQPKCISDRLTPESYERIILLVMQNWKQMQSIDEVIQLFLFCDRKFRDPLVHFLDW